ncbi:Holliday junction resolvase [Bifidobacterium sp. DSM 109958]|uniref:Putative pre-16S rRNA nuclease n=1 Tax=Bifidobacterium moraviense TaxID=2675323 RepID=A0A7Y0F072_9BIFI|nr:Holliday junction resolvase [Bifidobacterium sp. DSM 109958]
MAAVWLGVDLGDARVGLALSDPELTFAHPIGNVQVYGDSFHALDDVIDVIEEERVARVFVGLPLLMDGTEGKSAKKARRWAANLVKRLQSDDAAARFVDTSIPEVSLIDERLTTVSAHRQLSDARISSRGHRPKVDQQSAVNILQAALDRRAADARYASNEGAELG